MRPDAIRSLDVPATLCVQKENIASIFWPHQIVTSCLMKGLP